MQKLSDNEYKLIIKKTVETTLKHYTNIEYANGSP